MLLRRLILVTSLVDLCSLRSGSACGCVEDVCYSAEVSLESGVVLSSEGSGVDALVDVASVEGTEASAAGSGIEAELVSSDVSDGACAAPDDSEVIVISIGRDCV